MTLPPHTVSPWVRRALSVLVVLPLLALSSPMSTGSTGRNAAVSPSASTGVTGPATVAATDRRPNIVLITTDDQTEYDMRWMPITNRLIRDQGVSFTDGLAPHPLCCPARAMMLTGQYAQNNGVRHNDGPLGGYGRFDPEHTLATWLDDAGYQTAFVGKYLNLYRAEGREPGWDIWNPTIKGVYAYYGFTMYNNGQPRRYETQHNADLVGVKTAEYIRRFSRTGKPFFIWSSQVAPHGACAPTAELSCWRNAIPAARHARMFSRTRPPSISSPSYNEADVSDKPLHVRRLAKVLDRRTRLKFHARIRSLQAVDEAVGRTVGALRRAGELDNTLIAFVSDNGNFLGEHRLSGKNAAYEEALQVPMFLRGPGIPRGVKRGQQVGHLDLAPTFLAAAGARADIAVDGVNLLPLARRNVRPARNTVLLQSGPVTEAELPHGWFYRGVRTNRYTYVHYPATGEQELYDRSVDPYQLTSLHRRPRYAAVRAALAARLAVLGGCSGASCRAPFGALPALPPR